MPKMLHTHAEVEIARPPADVWAVVSDYPSDTIWRKGITEMAPDRPGGPQVGTAVREVLHLGGREYVTDTTVTDVGPGRRYRFAGHGTSGGVRGSRKVTEGTTAASSVFTYDVDLEPDALPRLARPVLGWWLQRRFDRDLVRLRRLLEAA